MKKLLFCGCSLVSGVGLDLEKDDPNLWVNLIHQNNFKDHMLVNSSLGGRSNAGIFQDAVFNLSKGDIDHAFICWTSMPRYELNLGVELYETRCCFLPNAAFRDYNLNDIKYPKKYLAEINDRFTSLVNLHFEILNLVYYVNSLVALSEKLNTKIYFVNALCPWDLNYFDKLENVLPSQYTNFTQQLLNVDNRSDNEVFDLYNKIHAEYQAAGSIQESFWLNLYNPLRSLRIDTNSDRVHPGIESNQLFYDTISKLL